MFSLAGDSWYSVSEKVESVAMNLPLNNVPRRAFLQQSAYGLVGFGHGFNARGQSHDHGKRGQSHCGGERQAANGDWVLGLFSGRFAHYAGNSGGGMGVADLDSLRASMFKRKDHRILRHTGFQNFVCIRPNSGDNT